MDFNVLMITVDQLRFDCLGHAGNPVVQTPNLDALAATGVTFDNAYAAATICVPARQSILTGQYPTAHGALTVRSAIPEDRDTLFRHISAAGVQTAAVGKMHFWPVYADYGIDRMILAEQDGPGYKIDDYHGTYLRERGLVDQVDLWDQQAAHRAEAPDRYWESYGAMSSHLPEEAYSTTWIADRTIEQLDVFDRDAPFLLWSSFIKPHHPFDPPAPYDTLYDPDRVVLPPRDELWRLKPLLTRFGDPRVGYFDAREMTEAQLRRVVAYYYGLITQIDHHVGRILEALRDRGLERDTMVVFFSDHGDYLGQFGLFLKHPNVPYDALARVPLTVAGPERLVRRPGRRTEALVSTMDLLPTLMDAAGLDLPDYVQGRSFLPELQDRDDAPEREAVFCETGDYRAVRTRRYKYIYSPAVERGELYDVIDDPYETRDLAGERPDLVEKHQRLLLDWLIEVSWDRYRHDGWDV